MAELSDDIHERIQELCAEGDDLLDQERYTDALALYRSAWELLPEPRSEWSAAEWIMAAIGDVHFFQGDFAAAKDAFMMVVKCGGSPDNPFLCLRLGQCLFELGDKKEAGSWLAGAYLLEGKELFDNEAPKYLEFIKPQLNPPPGGWPDGW